MRHADFLKEQAEKCRALSQTVIQPSVIEQLQIWAVELSEEAETLEREGADNEETIY